LSGRKKKEKLFTYGCFPLPSRCLSSFFIVPLVCAVCFGFSECLASSDCRKLIPACLDFNANFPDTAIQLGDCVKDARRKGHYALCSRSLNFPSFLASVERRVTNQLRNQAAISCINMHDTRDAIKYSASAIDCQLLRQNFEAADDGVLSLSSINCSSSRKLQLEWKFKFELR